MKQFALIFVCLMGVLVGCTPTEGEPVAVDRPTTLPTMTSEPWTINFLSNKWRIVEAISNDEKINYQTIHLTRFEIGQTEDGKEIIGLEAPCKLSDPNAILIGRPISVDEQLQQWTPLEQAIQTEIYCTDVSEGASKLFDLAVRSDVTLMKNGHQLIFESDKGKLVLEIDNAPIAWDTPMPTSTPNDNGYAQMYVTGHRLAEFIMAMPIPFSYEYIVDGEPVFIYTPDPEQWMVEALILEENAQKGDGTPLPFSLENVQLVQQGQVIVIEPVDAQTELWRTDLLQGNSWRVVEAINNTESLTYETLPLTRIQISDELKLSLIVPCKSTGLNRDSAQFQLALDEATQVMTVYQFGRDLEKDICGDRVSDQVNELFHLFFDMKTVTWANEQLLFEGEHGRLVLTIDNAPLLFDTPPPPTAYP